MLSTLAQWVSIMSRQASLIRHAVAEGGFDEDAAMLFVVAAHQVAAGCKKVLGKQDDVYCSFWDTDGEALKKCRDTFIHFDEWMTGSSPYQQKGSITITSGATVTASNARPNATLVVNRTTKAGEAENLQVHVNEVEVACMKLWHRVQSRV